LRLDFSPEDSKLTRGDTPFLSAHKETTMRIKSLYVAGACLLLAGCPSEESAVPTKLTVDPPVARIEPHELEQHGHTRTDNYYWLRERSSPEVISYLNQENDFTQAVLAHTEELQQQLYQEIIDRIPLDDRSVPYRKGDYYYYKRFEEGKEHPIHCRRLGSLDAPEEVFLDENVLAGEHEFFAVKGLQVSEDHKLLAYAQDTVGRRLYTLRFRDLESGQDLEESLVDVTGNSVWANDGQTIFYTRQHPETLRWYQALRHKLGTDPADDVLVYEEKDETFSIEVTKTTSRRFILIKSEQTLSTEVRYLKANRPLGKFKILQPRQDNHEYTVDHLGKHFYIRTNDQAKNFRLMQTAVATTGQEHWQEVLPHRTTTLLEGFRLFRDYLVTLEREAGLPKLRVVAHTTGESADITFDESSYDLAFGDNPSPDTDLLRFKYSSLTTPESIFDYHLASGSRELLKEEEVVGDFDKNNYQTERISAKASDGTLVPISLVYRSDLKHSDGNPLLLYAYGSYGYSIDTTFKSSILSLLDRGFTYAIAHVRGGQELGRDWYENGKLMQKKNTFTDFIACAEHLINEKYTQPNVLMAEGGSAGGLLIGAVLNMASELFRGMYTRVPFVDVVTTMLDEDIPLTTSEYDEWGDPNEKAAYDYMLSYSPYDNIEAKDYPNLLVTTGLHDSQVQYWEPAKFVAKLRALKTDDNSVLLKTDMEAGHSGAAGRFKKHHDTALKYAFMLDLVGPQE
jgi:oligopeptidase B